MKLSIVVPCYNEADNIPLILARFAEVITPDIELILVDNGSTDSSAAILKKLLPSFAFARTVRVKVNKGYGYGILTGLKAGTGDFLGYTHADMQTDPYDVIRAWEIIKNADYDCHILVKGDRINRPLFDKFFTFGMGIFETLYLGRHLYEINAQPNIFSREFFTSWDNPPTDFSLDLYVLYLATIKKLNIRRIKVKFPKRQHGSSKWNTGLVSKWKFIKRTLDFSVKLKSRLKGE